jgi:hypothetical protein
VKELKSEFPKAQVQEVPAAAHPVPFNAAVNQFVLQSLNLPAAVAVPVAPAAPPKSQPVREASQAVQLLMPLDTPEASTQAQPVAEVVAEPEPVVFASASVSTAHDEATQPRVGLLGLLKQLLGATKK